MMRQVSLSDEEVQYIINLLKFVDMNFDRLFSPDELQRLFNYSGIMKYTIYMELLALLQKFESIS